VRAFYVEELESVFFVDNRFIADASAFGCHRLRSANRRWRKA